MLATLGNAVKDGCSKMMRPRGSQIITRFCTTTWFAPWWSATLPSRLT